MKKDAVLAQFRTERVIALGPALPAVTLIGCARALAAGGVNSMEIAMTTPAAVEIIRRAAAELPEFRFGLGTVLDVETARQAILAGASFIVTPTLRPDVITLCRRFNVLVLSGASTVDAVATGRRAGADAAKVFPGELFGPAHVRSLKAALPDVPMIPIGGVTPHTIVEFLRAGALAVMAGDALLDPVLIARQDWDGLTARAASFRTAADSTPIAPTPVAT